MVKKNITVVCSDLTKVYGTPDPLRVELYDDEEAGRLKLSGLPVQFTIHGVTYTRNSNYLGVASLNINLGIGTYPCTIFFEGNNEYNGFTRNVTVKVTDKQGTLLISNGLVKTYGTSDQLKAQLYHNGGLPGKPVKFTINGVSYIRNTDSEGYAKLNINLRPGVYPTSIHFEGDSTYSAVSIRVDVIVKSDTRIEGINVTKKASETSVYQCAVYDAFNNRVDCDVVLTVNGVPYIRHTDGSGLAKLNIRLGAGDYTLTARYDGDATHNPSSASNTVHVTPDIESITTVHPDNYTIPGPNRGFMESHIYISEALADAADKSGYTVLSADLSTFHEKKGDIYFTNYEITETDPRVKTAKFTTPLYFDLTRGRQYAQITSPYHENFGGQILDVDYDKKTGLYTYQCQDGRRAYLSKRRTTRTGETATTIYDSLESLLIVPAISTRGNIPAPLPQDLRENAKSLLSGLRPLEAYNLKFSPITVKRNAYAEKCPPMLSYDSTIDKIMNLAHYGSTPVDVYFDQKGVCQIEPIDLDKWLSQGIKLVHSDLVEYKYGFDITNVITGVSVKAKNAAEFQDANYRYDEWTDLRFYFGGNFGMIDPVTTTDANTISAQQTTNTNPSTNNASGLMSGKKIFDVGQDYGIVPHYRLTLINKLRAAGHTVNDMGVGPSRVQNNGLRSSSKGHIAIFVCNGICCGTHQDFVNGMRRGSYHYDHAIFTWVRGDIVMSYKQAYAHDWYYGDIGLDKSITRHDMFVKNKDILSYVNLWPNGNNSAPLSTTDWGKQCDAIVNGQFNNQNGGTVTASSTTSTASDGSDTTTTVIDETATYNKALEAMSNSIRDLLSFEIKLPLNHPIFKNLHTNQMLWTELPAEFELGNLEKIFTIFGEATYKVNRGIKYLKNRFYVEKMVIKCDDKGLFATLTLNPFPSSYSSYTNAIKSYEDAYNQAFKANNTTNSTSTTSTSTSTSGSADQIFKEVAAICEKYRYSLGRGVSSYSGMKKAGHGDCWAFAELVYEELKARGVNAIIWTYAVQGGASNHRSAGYQAADGTWKDFPYRTYVTNPKPCVNGGNNWYFNFSRPSKASVIKKWTSGKGI